MWETWKQGNIKILKYGKQENKVTQKQGNREMWETWKQGNIKIWKTGK